MHTVFDVGLLITAVVWDLSSMILNVRRAIKGRGASGVPVISWLVYIVLVEWKKQIFFFTSAGQAGVVLTVFHILCHFGVPWTIVLLLRARRATSKAKSQTRI